MEVNVTSPQTQPISIAIQETQSFSVTTTERINATVLDKFSILGVNSVPDKSFVHNQGTPQTNWSITHNLGKNPSVTVVDSADNVVYGEVEYNSLNKVTLTFAGAFSGKAFFN